MPTERFSTTKFESILPIHKTTHQPLWSFVGWQNGERVYLVKVNDEVGIIVRSSIDKTSYAADTGENSIRCWLVDKNNKPLGTKVNKWTTREAGWEERLLKQLRTLWGWAKEAGNCPKCHQPKGVFRSKSKDNPKRIFTKCHHCNDGFKWLEE